MQKSISSGQLIIINLKFSGILFLSSNVLKTEFFKRFYSSSVYSNSFPSFFASIAGFSSFLPVAFGLLWSFVAFDLLFVTFSLKLCIGKIEQPLPKSTSSLHWVEVAMLGHWKKSSRRMQCPMIKDREIDSEQFGKTAGGALLRQSLSLMDAE